MHSLNLINIKKHPKENHCPEAVNSTLKYMWVIRLGQDKRTGIKIVNVPVYSII